MQRSHCCITADTISVTHQMASMAFWYGIFCHIQVGGKSLLRSKIKLMSS